MGIYHYTVQIAPRSWRDGRSSDAVSAAELKKGIDFWACHEPPTSSFLAKVRALLPLDRSWGDTEEYQSRAQFGSELRIWKDDSKIWLVEFKYSPVADNLSLLHELVAAARHEDYLLVEVESGAVLVPQEHVVQQHLLNSRAWKFAQDPEATFHEAIRANEHDA